MELAILVVSVAYSLFAVAWMVIYLIKLEKKVDIYNKMEC